MKKVLMMLLGVIFVASSASAMPIALNPDAVATLSGLGYGTTGVFDQLGIYSETTSTNNGDGTFSDYGDVKVTSLIDLPTGQWAGLNNDWFLAGVWYNISGNVTPTSTGAAFEYTSGSLNLYALSENPDFNTVALGADDDTGFIGGGGENTPGYNWVANLTLVSGTGAIYNASNTGTTDIVWKFNAILDGFWLDENLNPLSLEDLNEGEKLMAFSDMNSARINYVDNHIYSDHNGSVTVGVVPEPATMALFGTGLLGLAGAGLRKKKRS